MKRKRYLVPRRFATRYRTDNGRRWRATWWSWLGRVYRHRANPLDGGTT